MLKILIIWLQFLNADNKMNIEIAYAFLKGKY
jgi:hypothetical protein